jgi:hypothetical protein
MPNVDAPFGLRPIRHKSGAPYNGSFNTYHLPASEGTAMFIGDPVIKTSTANAAAITAPGAGKFPIGTVPEIVKATAGTTNRITGVIVGFAPDPDGLGRIHRPASTSRIAYVCDDPDVVFEIQADGSIVADQMGLNAVLIYTNAGSTVTGFSGAELSTGTTPATTVGFQLSMHRLVNREDNEPGAFARVEVTINTHTEVNASTGI